MSIKEKPIYNTLEMKEILKKIKPYTKEDIKTHIEETYPNSQTKMAIWYVGEYDTKNMILIRHLDYDENGKLMKFENNQIRMKWLSKMNDVSLSMSIKDYPTLWKCALEIRKMIINGSLSLSYTDGYKWAVKHCTIEGNKIQHHSKLRKAYENAKDRGTEEIINFEEDFSPR